MNTRFSHSSLHSAAFVLVALGTGSAFAQGLARISGAVTDASGAVVPNATVVARESATGTLTTVTSNASGQYVFPTLKPAGYTITVTAPGFGGFTQNNVLLEADQALSVNATLKIGGAAESIVVTSDAPQVDVTTSTMSQVVNGASINELPLNGRNAAGLTTLVAGVVVAPNQASDQGVTKTFPSVVTVTVNGSRANQTNYLLDGGNNVDEYTNVNAPFPFPDALQEFSVQTSNYNAEYGQNAGGVVNVITKSGANRFHGDVFYYNRNAIFNAANYFGYAQQTPTSPLVKTRDPLKRNQFGGTIGGPILHDKAFFFFGYQKTIVRNTPVANTAILPTPAQLTGQFSTTIVDPATCVTAAGKTTCQPFAGNLIPTSRFNSASLALLKYLPTADASGTVLYKKPLKQGFNEYIVRGDYQFSPKDRLSLRYFLDKFDNTGVLDLTNLITYSDGSNINYHNALISESHTFTPNLLNNFILTYQIDNASRGPLPGSISVADLGVNIYQPAFKQISGITVGGYFAIGDNPAATFRRNNYTLGDDLRWTRGNHSLAFGFHGELAKIDVDNQFQQPGVFGFSAALSGNNLADFLLGYLGSFSQASGQFLNNRNKFLGFYAQDTWKANRKLTLNYGIRYEPFFPIHEKFHRTGQFNPTAWANNVKSTVYPNAPSGLLFVGDTGVPEDAIKPSYDHFMPRVGFAYDVFGTGRTSVRGGAGLFYETRLDGVFNNGFSTNTPFVQSVGLSFNNPTYFGYTSGNFKNPYAGSANATTNPFPAQQPPPSNITFLPQNFITFDPSGNFPVPLTYNWNLAVEQQVTKALVGRIAYVASHISHNFVSLDINPVINSGANINKRVYATSATSSAYTSQITQTSMIGNATYQSLQLSLEQRLANGLTLLFNYTYSKALDDLPFNNGVTSAGAGNSYVLPVYEPNYKRLDYGPSDFDHRNVVSFSYVYRIHKFESLPRAARLIVNGWQTTGLMQFRSGDALTIVSGANNSGTGLGRDRAVMVGSPYGSAACTGYAANKPCQSFLASSGFTANPSYATNPALAYGNVQKGSVIGPSYYNWDAAVHRYFDFKDNVSLQFRAEYFNVLNHTILGDPTTTLNNTNFGRVLSTNGDPRIGQLSLKVLF